MTDTTIQIDIETRERLKELGKKDDTYDQIILALIDEHKRRLSIKVAKPNKS